MSAFARDSMCSLMRRGFYAEPVKKAAAVRSMKALQDDTLTDRVVDSCRVVRKNRTVCLGLTMDKENPYAPSPVLAAESEAQAPPRKRMSQADLVAFFSFLCLGIALVSAFTYQKQQDNFTSWTFDRYVAHFGLVVAQGASLICLAGCLVELVTHVYRSTGLIMLAMLANCASLAIVALVYLY